MSTGKKIVLLMSAFILSIGILGAGYSIGKALYLAKKMSRSVTVKGLAEKDIKSDLGIWEINYREIGSDLVQINQQLLRDEQLVTAFLKQHGIHDQEIERVQLKIEDRLANLYAQQNQQTPGQRYVVTSGLRIRSTQVDLIQKTAQIIDQLLQQGVPLAFDIGSINPNPSFYYTQLDSIRPGMMAEATKSAKIVAAQFAKDSSSQLAGIQHASQGLFQIMGRDTSTLSSDWNSNQSALGSVYKKVRLVTTIEYGLK